MIRLKRDSHIFQYHTEFGSTTDILPTLIVDAGHMDIEPVGSEACTCYTVCNIMSAITGKTYDILWQWTQMVAHGRASLSGASSQDAFAEGINGVKVVLTGEVETPVVAYFQVDTGPLDFYGNVQSAIQLEFNKGLKRPIGVGTVWYPNWLSAGVNGTLPPGQGKPTDHEWEVCGWDVDHPGCFKINAWLGYYVYMPQAIFNTAMDATYGSVALTFAETSQEKIDYLKTVEISAIQICLDFCYNLLHRLRIMQ